MKYVCKCKLGTCVSKIDEKPKHCVKTGEPMSLWSGTEDSRSDFSWKMYRRYRNGAPIRVYDHDTGEVSYYVSGVEFAKSISIGSGAVACAMKRGSLIAKRYEVSPMGAVGSRVLHGRKIAATKGYDIFKAYMYLETPKVTDPYNGYGYETIFGEAKEGRDEEFDMLLKQNLSKEEYEQLKDIGGW